MKNRTSLRDLLLFRKKLIFEMDIDVLSMSLFFYRSNNISKNKITPNSLDINFLYNRFRINPDQMFNAKIRKHESKEGFCVIEVKMLDFQLFVYYIIFAIVLISLSTIAYFSHLYFQLFIAFLFITFAFFYLNSLFTNSIYSLIKELQGIPSKYVTKYEEVMKKKKFGKRRY